MSIVISVENGKWFCILIVNTIELLLSTIKILKQICLLFGFYSMFHKKVTIQNY